MKTMLKEKFKNRMWDRKFVTYKNKKTKKNKQYYTSDYRKKSQDGENTLCL